MIYITKNTKENMDTHDRLQKLFFFLVKCMIKKDTKVLETNEKGVASEQALYVFNLSKSVVSREGSED